MINNRRASQWTSAKIYTYMIDSLGGWWRKLFEYFKQCADAIEQ